MLSLLMRKRRTGCRLPLSFRRWVSEREAARLWLSGCSELNMAALDSSVMEGKCDCALLMKKQQLSSYADRKGFWVSVPTVCGEEKTLDIFNLHCWIFFFCLIFLSLCLCILINKVIAFSFPQSAMLFLKHNYSSITYHFCFVVYQRLDLAITRRKRLNWPHLLLLIWFPWWFLTELHMFLITLCLRSCWQYIK